MTDEILLETEDKMQKAIEVMENRFLNVRAGRANPRILDKVMPEYYGTPTPLIQLANISVPEARKIVIKPFDRSIIKDIERATNLSYAEINTTMRKHPTIFKRIKEQLVVNKQQAEIKKKEKYNFNLISFLFS